LKNFGGSIDTPPARTLRERSAPFLQSCFAVVNFLAAADQRDDRRPISVPFHYAQQHFRFRVVAIEFFLILTSIPCPLSLVEDDGVIGRVKEIVIHVVASENVDIFDQSSGL